MATTDESPQKVSPLDADPYTLTSVSKAEAPDGASVASWHRYVITQGANTMVGLLPGSAPTTERAAREIVDRLNERRRGKTGKTPMSPGRKKKTSSS